LGSGVFEELERGFLEFKGSEESGRKDQRNQGEVRIEESEEGQESGRSEE